MAPDPRKVSLVAPAVALAAAVVAAALFFTKMFGLW